MKLGMIDTNRDMQPFQSHNGLIHFQKSKLVYADEIQQRIEPTNQNILQGGSGARDGSDMLSVVGA